MILSIGSFRNASRKELNFMKRHEKKEGSVSYRRVDVVFLVLIVFVVILGASPLSQISNVTATF